MSNSRNKNGTKNTKKILRFSSSQSSLLEANSDQLEELNTKKPVYYSCLDIECEAGGVCIMDESHSDKRIRCKCPLGRGGFFCEKRKLLCNCFYGYCFYFKAFITDDKYFSILFVITAVEIRFPRFRGTSYLALPTLRDAHRSMQINIEFRPEHYDGVLLYSGEQQTLEGDFIAVILNQGFAEFRSVNMTVKYYSYKLLSKLNFIHQISILN